MPGEQLKAKKWRLQFSVRTLFVVVTLVALYLGAWELTRHWGIGLTAPERRKTASPGMRPLPFDSSPAPFIVSRQRYYNLPPKYGDYREYHVWFFGFTAALPFERAVK